MRGIEIIRHIVPDFKWVQFKPHHHVEEPTSEELIRSAIWKRLIELLEEENPR